MLPERTTTSAAGSCRLKSRRKASTSPGETGAPGSRNSVLRPAASSRTLMQQRVSAAVWVKRLVMPGSTIRLSNRAPLWPPTKPMAVTGSPARAATRDTFIPLPPAVLFTSRTRATS